MAHENDTLYQCHQPLRLFDIANEPIGRFCNSTLRMLTIRPGTPKSDVLQLARRYDMSAIPIETVSGQERRITGYVRIVDLLLDSHSVIEEDLVRPLPEISHRQTYLWAMLELRRTGQSMARVIDEHGQTVGLLPERNLSKPLFRNE